MVVHLPHLQVACFVGIIVVAAFKNMLDHEVTSGVVTGFKSIDFMWRLLLGLGCAPAALALYFRLTIPETPRFTMDIERNIKKAEADIHDIVQSGKYRNDPDAVVQKVDAPRAGFEDFYAHFRQWQNLKGLLAVSYSWFALDVAFYGLTINSAIILSAIGFGSGVQAGVCPRSIAARSLLYRSIWRVSEPRLTRCPW